MSLMSTFVLVALQAVAGVNEQREAFGACLLAIDARNKSSVRRSESLAQRSVQTQPSKVKGLFDFTVHDPITRPDVAARLLYAIIGSGFALIILVKTKVSAAGTGKGITVPKQDSERESERKKERKKEKEGYEALQPARARTVTVQSLNGLRVLFIARVILSHYFEEDPECILGLQLAEFYKYMPMAFFTVLSGFMRTISIKESGGFGVDAWLLYAVKVIARLGPAYWLAIVLKSYLGGFQRPYLLWPAQAAFMQAFMPFHMEGGYFDYFPLAGGIGVGWFVSCIVICSCIFPGVFNMSLWLGTHEKKWRGVACILILLALRFALDYTIRQDQNGYVRLVEFFMGMLTAQVCSLMDREIVQWQGWGWVFDGLMVVFMTTPLFVDKIPKGSGTEPWRYGIAPCFAPLLWCILVTAAWAAAQHAGLQGQPSSGLLGKLVSLRPLTSLAEYSFGAYIYQHVAMDFATQYIDGSCHSLWIGVILSWGMAFASEKLFEKHFRF